MNKSKAMHHWRFFLSLEKDFINLQNYIEIDEKNFNTFSLELAKLLQTACAEIESVLRLLCRQLDSESPFSDSGDKNGEMKKYKKLINRHLSGFFQAEVSLPHLEQSIKPWENWSNANPPDWWSSYNSVKHHRHSEFHQANLENVIYALSGLLLCNLYLYRKVVGEPYATPNKIPEYFDCEYTARRMACRADFELPGFEVK
ncbi:hypothetical protein [Vibrio diazotrophicus]|uniref:hypothetical protein n=1 Tax=Vibrio diazotrophicus TaxID=685 RepID=UPI000C9E80DD|nr:hypothetical protein [Vibrio diazotrophicus]PNH91937.1 hypothetical protein C1O24_20900 [Vibrio diazotrophicus]